jgi:hypothetical protein
MDIVVTCAAGLGNRLIPLYSTQDIYIKYGIKFRYYWPYQECVQVATLKDLFDHDFDEFTEDNEYLVHNLEQKTSCAPLTKEDLVKNINWLNPYARFIDDNDETDYYAAFCSIKIQPDILAKVDVLNINKNFIGLHIRGGDLKHKADDHDPQDNRSATPQTLHQSLRYIDNILKNNPSQYFFVSCEDEEDQRQIYKLLGDNMIAINGQYSRCTKNGCKDAFANIIALSKCGMVLGNVGSTFAGVACAIGGTEHKVINE